MPKKRRNKRTPPPPPANAADYELVKSKEGWYWRKKRKHIPLNEVFKKNNKLATVASPAAKLIRAKLEPFLKEMDTGRFIARISSKLLQTMGKTGRIDYSFLKGYEMQPERPLSQLLRAEPMVYTRNDEVIALIPGDTDIIKRHAKFVTGYFFELILLHGDPSKPSQLRIEWEASPVYHFDSTGNKKSKLSLTLPGKNKPWMVLIKVSCMEKDQLVTGARYHGMKVMLAG